MRSTGNSYSRTREIVSQAFVELGYKENLFGLHSLRAGSASAAANAGVSDRLFKLHGRWKSVKFKFKFNDTFYQCTAKKKKYIYIKDNSW